MRLAVALPALMALAGCSRTALVGPKIDPALTTLMPPDTVAAIGARVEDLMKTPFYQKHFADLSVEQMDEFARETGLDPRKSLWELLFISDGKHRAMLGRGRFGDQMEAKLERQGASRIPYKGLSLIGAERLAVVFLNDTTAAVGDADSLRALIDARPKSHGPPPAIAERMKDVSSDAQLWAVYTGGGGSLLGDLPQSLPGNGSLAANLANLNRMVGSLQSVSAYADLRAGIAAKVHGVYASEEDARMVRDALKAFVGFGRLSTPADKTDLLRAYDAIEITQQSRDLNISILEPQDLADKFLKQWTGH